MMVDFDIQSLVYIVYVLLDMTLQSIKEIKSFEPWETMYQFSHM